MQISVVIPTCNRRDRLLLLLDHLNRSSLVVKEVVIVDSGEDLLTPEEYQVFTNLKILYLYSEKSVCIQRNIGIARAQGDWIFLCDDDIEVPPDYLFKISEHLSLHPATAAVSGVVLQKEKDAWTGSYPVRSARQLLLKFVFQQSIWGAIECRTNNFVVKKIKNFYHRKGNHISKAGWPVITEFSGNYFTTPVYGLGASVIRKDWLLNSPYSEVLDRHGIGDNYGVAMNFPGNIHVLSNAFVFHHQEPSNRLQRPLQYFRRVLALDYFIKTSSRLQFVKKRWLLWSLIGNLLEFVFVRDRMMIRSACRVTMIILSGRNPYYRAAKENRKVVEPV